MRLQPTRTVDHRIARAIALALASCQKSPDVQPSNAGVTATETATLSTATAPPEDLTVAGDPVPTAMPSVAAGAETKPDEFCAQYKASVKVDTTRVKQAQTAHHSPIHERAYWDPQKKLVSCTVIRAEKDTTITVTRVPVCCPVPGPSQPCSPPYKENAPAVHVVIEQAELHPDGKVASSKLSAHVFEKHPQAQHACGRRPEGLVLEAPAAGPTSRVGAELACMAELEAASVPAFGRLARELRAHGAPASLVRRAQAAARDEVRHAHAMGQLAARHGAKVGAAKHPALGVRALLPIALENAVEGCVREAYGALVASYQAERAAPSLRKTFRSIARDERTHAALAEDVERWLATRLDEGARAQVAHARAAASAELRATLETSSGCDTLGLPGPHVALALFDAYFADAA
jgi:hypothetical protein